ncbi:MAG: hypothetical protein AB8B85_01895 [Paracoccaceae bacterium]
MWLLANLNSGKDKVRQIIMIGQPELRDTLRVPELGQLAQRMMATYHLEPKTQVATAAYVGHRLQYATGTGHEFTAKASRYIHGRVEDIRRMVNKICDLALVYATGASEIGLSWSLSRRSRKMCRSPHSIFVLSNPIIKRVKAAG